MAMYCTNCQKFIDDADPVHCPYCGHSLKKTKFFSNIFRVFKKDKTENFKEKQNEIPSQKSVLVEHPTRLEITQVENLMRQLQESVDFVNNTTSPRTFWGRLNLALDILLELKKYEKYGLFKESTPTKDYNKILDNLEPIVNAFIDRVIVAQSDKNELLNNQREKDKRMLKCVKNLWNSFYEANDYWQGNNTFPHYAGKLYSESNFKRIDDILNDLELKSIYNQEIY